MPKLSVGSWSFVLGPYADRPLSFHTVLHALEDAGVAGLELGAFAPHPTPRSHDTKEKRDRLRKEVADHGLTFSALLPDPNADFDEQVRFAVDLGIGTVIVPRPPAAPDPTGVRLAWEFGTEAPSTLVPLAENTRVLFDTCNADLSAKAENLPGGAAELLARLTDKIVHIHIADSDGMGRHVPPGQGRLKWDALVPALLKTRAEWWTIDLGDWPEAFDAVSESKRFLTKLLKKHAAM